MSINRRRGKDTEKAVAKILGGKRIGILGGEDIHHPIFSIEAKSREKFSGQKFMEQAERNAPHGKIPIVVVHVQGTQHRHDLVMMKLEDFEDWCRRTRT